jgi:broad specificity phosphatase PhoE
MKPRLLTLVRHAQAAFDDDDYDRLSPLGRVQAARLGEWWRAIGRRPEVFWSGGMRRHDQTAQDCAKALASGGAAATPGELRVEARLREFDHREVFYAHRPDLRDRAALERWKAEGADYPARFERTYAEALSRWIGGTQPGDYSETWSQFRARCLDGLAAILASDAPETDRVLFTSSGPISVLVQACWGIADAQIGALQASLRNCALTELSAVVNAPAGATGLPHAGQPWRLGAVNACPHLAATPHELSWR